MSLASLTIDIIANFGKFEGDLGKAAQIVTSSSESMTKAQSAFLKELERTGGAANKLGIDYRAVQAATLGLSDSYDRFIGKVASGSAAVTAAGNGNASAFAAAGNAADAAGIKQQSISDQLVESINKVRIAYLQQKDAAIKANEAGQLTDPGLSARLKGLGSEYKSYVETLKQAAAKEAAAKAAADAEIALAEQRRAAALKVIDAQNGLTASYRAQLAALRELRDAGSITPAQFKQAGTELVSKQPGVKQRSEELAETRALATAQAAASSAFIANIEAEIVKTRQLASELGLTKTQVLELKAAGQGQLVSAGDSIARLKAEQDAYERIAKNVREAEAAKAAKSNFAEKIAAELAVQQKLAAEFGKTEGQIKLLQAAELGLTNALSQQILQTEALKASNESLARTRSEASARKAAGDAFISDLIREREEAGKTVEQLQAYKAAKLGIDTRVSAPIIQGASNDRFLQEIEQQIAAEKRKLDAISNTTAEIFRQRAAERGQTDSGTAEKINELERVAKAHDNAAEAAKRQKAAEAFLASVNRTASSINVDGTQKAQSALLAEQAAILGVSREAQASIAKIAALDAKTGQLGRSAFASNNQLLTLQYTIGDIAASAASGISPLTILLQQGGQVFDAFSGDKGGFGSVFKGLASFITPLRLVLAGVATAAVSVGVAMFKGAQESKAFADAMVLTGNYAGITEGQFNSLAKQIAATGEVNIANARDFTRALISTGEVGPQVLGAAAEAAARYGDATGKTSKEVAADFASMGRDVSGWAAEHNRSLNFVTYAQLQQIKTLQEQGRTVEAQALVYEALNERLRKLEPNLGTLDRAIRAVTTTWKGFWDAAFDIGRAETIDDKIERAGKSLDALQRRAAVGRNSLPAFSSAPDLREGDRGDDTARTQALLRGKTAEFVALQQAKAFQEAAVASEALQAQQTKEAQAADTIIGKYAQAGKSADRYKKALVELNAAFDARARAGSPVSDVDREAALKGLKDQFTDKGGNGGRKAENEAEQARKAQLEQDLKALQDGLVAQRAVYTFHNQELQAIYQAGNVSLKAFYDDRNANIAAGVAKELETLEKERVRLAQYRDLATTDPSDKIKTQTRIDEASAKSAELQAEASRAVRLSNLEQAAAFKVLGDRVNEYRAQLLQLSGDERAAAEIRAQQAVTAARLLAAQSAQPAQTTGDFSRLDRGQSQVGPDPDKLARLLALTNNLNEARKQGGIVSANLSRAEEEFALRSERNGLSLAETERGLFELRSRALDQLRALAEQTQVLAEASAKENGGIADPTIFAEAADAALRYARAVESVDPALTRLKDAGKDAASSLASSIGDAIVNFSSFRDLIGSIEKDLLRIGTKLLITDNLEKGAQSFFKEFTEGGSGFASGLRSIVGVKAPAAAGGLVDAAGSAATTAASTTAIATAGTAISTALTASGATAAAGIGTSAATVATSIGGAAATASIAIQGAGTAVAGALTAAAAAIANAGGASGASGLAGFVGPLLGSAKGNAFLSTGVATFAKGGAFSQDPVFKFASGGAFGKDAGAAINKITVTPFAKGDSFSSVVDARSPSSKNTVTVVPFAKGGQFGGELQSASKVAQPKAFALGGAFKASDDQKPSAYAAKPFAAGGTFTNQVITAPTMFRFKQGGEFALGLMGEAGDEAVMPLKGPRSEQGVQSYNADGSAGPVLKLMRGSGGSLGVQAFAKGGKFEEAQDTPRVRAFAMGGKFHASRAAPKQSSVIHDDVVPFANGGTFGAAKVQVTDARRPKRFASGGTFTDIGLVRTASPTRRVQAFARGASFRMAAAGTPRVHAFAEGGTFMSSPATIAQPTVMAVRSGQSAVGSGVATKVGGSVSMNVEQHFHFSGAKPDRRTMLQVGAEAQAGLTRAQRNL